MRASHPAPMSHALRALAALATLVGASGCITEGAYESVALVEREAVGPIVALRAERAKSGGPAIVDVVVRRADGTLLAYHVESQERGDFAEGIPTESDLLPAGGAPFLLAAASPRDGLVK